MQGSLARIFWWECFRGLADCGCSIQSKRIQVMISGSGRRDDLQQYMTLGRCRGLAGIDAGLGVQQSYWTGKDMVVAENT